MLKRIRLLLMQNPVGEYLASVYNAISNQARWRSYTQGYLTHVSGCQAEHHVRVSDHSLVTDCQIGAFSYVGAGSLVARANIGRYCSIGPGCRIGLGKHPSRDFVSTSPMFFSTAQQTGTTFTSVTTYEEFEPITIGHDVWIGANVLIKDGTSVGNGAIIGAGAVVVSDVPAYAIVGGIPARLIRYRFSESQIRWLQDLCWWNREESWLRAHADCFQNIERLMKTVPDEADSSRQCKEV